MVFVWVGLIVAGAVCVACGLLMGYLGLLAALFPEKLRTREVGTVVTADLWKLRICRFRRGRTEGEPVLLVHGLGTNHHNFTEPANGCLVDYLVEKGFDCWALDLRGTRSSQAPFERDPKATHVDDFALYDVPAAIEHIRKATGYAKVHYVGHSLGGMALYMYAQVCGTDAIGTGVAIGTPIGFDDVRAKAGLRLLPVIKRYPKLAGELLRGLLPLIAPLRINVGVFPMNGRNVHSSMKVGEFYNMIDVPTPTVMTEMAQMLRKRQWRMQNNHDVKAGLSTLNLPLFVIVGGRDPFTPLARVRAFFDALPSADKKLLVCSKDSGCRQDYGHCDLAFGLDGAKAVFRPIADWLAEHPIRERVQHAADVDAHLMTPLDGEARSEILTGNPFERSRDEEPVEAPELEAPVALIVQSEALRERQAALQGFALRVAASAGKPVAAAPAVERRKSVTPKAAESSPKETAPAKKPAVKKPAAKPAAKPKPQTKPTPIAKTTPAAKSKPAAKAQPAAKPKPATAKASAGKGKTLSVLAAASEDLKKLDKRR